MGRNPRGSLQGAPSAWMSSGVRSRGVGARVPQGVPGGKDLVKALTFPSLSCDPRGPHPTDPFSLSILGSLALILRIMVASELSTCHIISLLAH